MERKFCSSQSIVPRAEVISEGGGVGTLTAIRRGTGGLERETLFTSRRRKLNFSPYTNIESLSLSLSLSFSRSLLTACRKPTVD